MMSSYPKNQQEDIWNLSRYPNLISRIVQGGQKSNADLETIFSSYPQEIHDVALKYGTNNYDLLLKVDALQTQTNQQFQQIINSYPSDVQQTFTNLLQLPEVMNLLNDHLSLTVRVGDHFRRDPDWVMHKSDSTAQAQAKLNTEQLNDWMQTIHQDTAAQNELKQAANDYADSNGYNTGDVDAPVDESAVNNYSVYPYSYWFGYPSWYPYAYWYPYPYWYDWGFYYGPGGEMIVFGFPSYYFINWYFWYPSHCQRYPHLGSAYIHHYYGPHRSNTLSRQVVHNWVHENRKYLPADFIKNNSSASRSEAIRQMGLLNEKAVDRTGRINPQTRDQYLAKNTASFPALRTNPAAAKIPDESQMPEVRQQVTRQPAVNPQRAQSQRIQPQQQQQQTQPRNNNSQYNYNNIQPAQQYHSGGWDQAQPRQQAPPQQEQRQYQAPQQQAPQPRSMPSAPPRSSGGGSRPK